MASRHHLLASQYATPGRVAFGCLGTVPNDEDAKMWGAMDWSGLQIAAGYHTEFCENVRAPCLVRASTKLKMQKPVTGIFHVRAFVHRPT